MPQVSQAALIRSVCRESYYEFVKRFWPTVNYGRPLVDNWHVKYLCDTLQGAFERVMTCKPCEGNFVCNQPPGTTKTTIFSIMPTPWLWVRDQSIAFLGASYTEDIAQLSALRGRDVIRSEMYATCFPEVEVRDDTDRKGRYMTTRGGMRRAVGVGTFLQSEHFDILCQDDPIDPTGAHSKADLAGVAYWKSQSFSRRKKDPTVALEMLVMQRLAQGDPTDDALQEPGARHICLPGTTEFPIHPPELVKYYKDGLLDPIRYPKTILDGLRHPKSMGEYGYAAQIGQTPIPLSGGKFNVSMLRSAIPPSEFKRVCRSWDKAVTPQKGGGLLGRQPDWTVGTLIGIDAEDRVWILDVRRFRLDSFSREQAMASTAEMDGYLVNIAIEKEPGSGGTDSAEASAKRLLGYRVKLVPASGSKEARADSFSYAVNAGLVYLPAKMRHGNAWVGWAADWVNELQYFPNGKYDDQIDSASLGFTQVSRAKIRIGAI